MRFSKKLEAQLDQAFQLDNNRLSQLEEFRDVLNCIIQEFAYGISTMPPALKEELDVAEITDFFEVYYKEVDKLADEQSEVVRNYSGRESYREWLEDEEALELERANQNT